MSRLKVPRILELTRKELQLHRHLLQTLKETIRFQRLELPLNRMLTIVALLWSKIRTRQRNKPKMKVQHQTKSQSPQTKPLVTICSPSRWIRMMWTRRLVRVRIIVISVIRRQQLHQVRSPRQWQPQIKRRSFP